MSSVASEQPKIAEPAPAADTWFTPGRFAAVLAALIVVCFAQVVMGSETFFLRDFGGFTYPLAFYHREAFWHGKMPFWNPYNNCGLPFLAQWNTLTLYPLSLIYLLLPLNWSLGVFCLFHLFLAGIGMYFLAWHWTGNRLAAAIGGVAFAFNGLTWYALMWSNNIAALGWMPWVVLAMDSAWRKGGKAIVVAGFAGAMQMLAGAPEVILLTWCALGALWLGQFATGDTPRIKLLLRLAAAWALVVLLSSAQLLPFLDLLRRSQRTVNFSDAQWAMPRSGVLNYLVPLFHLQPSSNGPYSQPGQYWTGSYYLGVGTIAFAMFAFWRARNLRVWLLLALAVTSVAVAMGNNGIVYGLLRRALPQLGFLRFPIKAVVLASFAVPALAVCGVARLQALPAPQWPAERRRLLMIGAGLLLLIAAIAAMACQFPHARHDPAISYDVTGTIRNALSRGAFLTAILGALIALRCEITPRLSKLLSVGLVLLFWFDVYTHSPNLSPTVAKSVYSEDAIRQYYHWDGQLTAGTSRAMPTPTSVLKMQFATLEKPADDITGRRLALFSDYNLLDHVPKVDGFYSLYLAEADAVTVWLYTVTNGLSPLKDFLGVSQSSEPTNITEWVARDSCMPMLTTGQKPVFVNDSTAFHTLISEQFEPRKTVYLPLRAQSSITAKGGEQARVVSQQVSAERVTAQVEASAPAMLVIAQAYYHRWHAYIDGRRVQLWPANYAYQGLEVPAGKHEIVLAYEDTAFLDGVGLSLFSLIFCVGILAAKRR